MDQKRNKHITINMTIDDYNQLCTLARLLRRNTSELASMILIDNCNRLFIEYHYKDNLKPVRFIPSSDIDDIKIN